MLRVFYLFDKMILKNQSYQISFITLEATCKSLNLLGLQPIFDC